MLPAIISVWNWGSTRGLVNSKPVEVDENGKKIGVGTYFGWGIAHEIGHNINQGSYANC